jgi:hypothetical protein
MIKKIIITGIVLSTLIVSSCLKDLDVKPLDKSYILSGNLGDSAIYMKQTLGKIYASFIISGQSGTLVDIVAADPNFFTTMRALWNCQEITTDEAINAWADAGISELNTQTWSPSNPFLTALYQRLGLSITYSNDFIQLTNGNSDPDVVRYNSEARYLRALAYFWYMDLFGNPPFTTDADGVGKFFPKQIKRAKLFDYVESELLAIENKLGEPGFSYPQADKGACWMLLSRLYLNAEVYTGKARWEDCKTYCDKVINSGKYELAANYRKNFCADNANNALDKNSEMIFAWEQDGSRSNGYVGTTFIIQSCSDPKYLSAITMHNLPSNPNWNGNRARVQFLNVFIDTLATYGNIPVPATDTFFRQCKDTRLYLKQKKSLDIPSANSIGDYGIGVFKFTGKNLDGTKANAAGYSTSYASTDYPIFRYAEAFLNRAEALHRSGNDADALADINIVRERAYGNTSGNITLAQLTDQFILDERAREFYYEGHRRTDLIRFGKFTDGGYNWVWKGGTYGGANTSPDLNIFPIPGDEVSANPNFDQNVGYN